MVFDNNNNLNGNNNYNNGCVVGMTLEYQELCSKENLEIAYNKAKKGKSNKRYVIEFEKDLKQNLNQLRLELIFHSYQPKPLKSFVIKDPKTRIIHKSDFRDRIVHHALCNIIEPIFDKTFIYDSYANRKGKGTLKAIQRFEQFQRKVSKNNTKICYVLKADIKHYFENVNIKILINILKTKIKDEKIIRLIKVILKNYSKDKGMPLGNLTSQFFANVYLNELDQYIKHTLKVKYYIRYVDDFVILSSSKEELIILKEKINDFLQKQLKLTLHPDKSKIIILKHGVKFLGAKIFYYHKIIPKKNRQKFFRKYNLLKTENYDAIYNFVEGWLAYIRNMDSYNQELKIFSLLSNKEVSTKEINKLIKFE